MKPYTINRNIVRWQFEFDFYWKFNEWFNQFQWKHWYVIHFMMRSESFAFKAFISTANQKLDEWQ